MPAVREAAREAGRIACSYFQRGGKTTARVWSKHGGSPVTEADVAVDSFLKVRLIEALPGRRLAVGGDDGRSGAPWRAAAAGSSTRSTAHAPFCPATPTGRSPSPSSSTASRCWGSSMPRRHGLLYEACRGARRLPRERRDLGVGTNRARRRAGRRTEAADRPAAAHRRTVARGRADSVARAAPRARRRGRGRSRPRVRRIPAIGILPPPTSSSPKPAAGSRPSRARGRATTGPSRSMASSSPRPPGCIRGLSRP